jgi:hypothetical protein
MSDTDDVETTTTETHTDETHTEKTTETHGGSAAEAHEQDQIRSVRAVGEDR